MNGLATQSPLSEGGWSSEWSTEVEAGPYETETPQEAPSFETLYAAPAMTSEGAYELSSPFLSGTVFGDSRSNGTSTPPSSLSLTSPFLAGYVPTTQEDRQAEVFQQLLAELEDEQFEQSLAQLVNEAAGQYLAAEASWSSAQEAPAQAVSELERWLDPLRTEMERLLEDVSNRLAAEEFEALRESELDHLLESMRPEQGMLPEAFEDFLGGFFNKVANVAKGAWNLAKKGVDAIGKILPINVILGKITGMVQPLLQKVIQKAVALLPANVQPLARNLAAKMLGSSGAEASEAVFEDAGMGREFDVHVASLLMAPSESEASNSVSEFEAGARDWEAHAALTELDGARTRLTQQFAELPAGESPVAELEEFIPAVMAVLPLVRMGIGMIGRDRVVGFLAERVAGLIRGMVGEDAAKALSRPIVNVGMRMLSLEAPTGGEATLGSEALVATVEDTVRHVMELPSEAFEDTLRLEAEIQQAFTAAAARHVPGDFLRADLPERETAGEGGVWILMPRATRPRFRYKKYTRVFAVPITRQVARAIPFSDGGTLEAHLLDRGVTNWPVQVEVHLFETLPGGHLGHIAQFESEASGSMSETIGELQPLTTEAASLLMREPALGRPGSNVRDHRGGSAAAHGKAGQRFYRLQLPRTGRPGSAKPHHRFLVQLDLSSAVPEVRVHLRLSEREAQHIASQLNPTSLPGVIGWLKERYERMAPTAFAHRLIKHGQRLLGIAVNPQTAEKLGAEMTEGLTRAVSKLVGTRQQELAAAVRDPAQGVTIMFTFAMPGAAGQSGKPMPEPSVTVRSGWHGHAGGQQRVGQAATGSWSRPRG